MSDQEQEAMKNGVSRRGFLKAGGAAMGAMVLGGVAGCGDNTTIIKSSSALPSTWTKTADVIVVGCGGAGIMAALSAKDDGASVIVLEKAAAPGGDTALSAQGAAIILSDALQKQIGISDSKELYIKEYKGSYKYSMKYLKGKITAEPTDVPLFQRYAELGGEALEYSTTKGINWMAIDAPSSASAPLPGWETVSRIAFATNTVMAGPLKAAADAGIEIITKTWTTKLFTDSNGRVVGVEAYDVNNAKVTYRAKKAVIIASGSPCGDRGFVSKYDPPLAATFSGGAPSNTGDGAKMAMAVGGVLHEMDLGFQWIPTEDNTNSMAYLNYQIQLYDDATPKHVIGVSGLLINFEGKRFTNECDGYSHSMIATFDQTAHKAYFVYDSQVAEAYQATKSAQFLTADTISELAVKMRVDPATLVAEVNKYNGYVTAGEDKDFGKYLYGVTPTNKGPFYAHLLAPRPYFMFGGLKTDVDSHVIDINGKIIPGLYAAGSVCGSYAEQAGLLYNGGVGQAVAFGRQAGRNAAKEKAA